LFIDFLADDFDQFLVAFELDFAGITDFVDFGNRILVMRSDHLGAIVPIRLVPVIFFRVVRSGQDNTALASQLADGI